MVRGKEAAAVAFPEGVLFLFYPATSKGSKSPDRFRCSSFQHLHEGNDSYLTQVIVSIVWSLKNLYNLYFFCMQFAFFSDLPL